MRKHHRKASPVGRGGSFSVASALASIIYWQHRLTRRWDEEANQSTMLDSGRSSKSPRSPARFPAPFELMGRLVDHL